MMMEKIFAKTIVAAVCLCAYMTVGAGENQKQPPGDSAKALSGISIVGNKEAPKSLFIVPWKSSDLGVETELSSRLLNEKLMAVDKEVFERELEFHYAATSK